MNKEDTRLYGECAYLLDKIFDKTEEMGGWDELINMLASIDEDVFSTQEETYKLYYTFIKNVYWRIHTWTEPQKFNKVHKHKVCKSVSGGVIPKATMVEGYAIWNYDYKMFLWAMKKGLSRYMSTGGIDVPADLLTPTEAQSFEKQANETNN